jgi:DNA-binding transcriptional LysR family regulator
VLAEELHFGRAARRLHVAQPAVSQQLQRLEDQLGVRLFERSTQHVSLAAEGEVVLPYARQAVAAAAAVERAAQEAAGSSEATLAVGLSLGVHYLAERALARLAETDPHVRVGAIAANTGSVARRVADGTLEIGLGFATQPAHGVRLEAIAEVPAVAAVASGHPLGGGPLRFASWPAGASRRSTRSKAPATTAPSASSVSRRASSPSRPSGPQARWHGRPRCAAVIASA